MERSARRLPFRRRINDCVGTHDHRRDSDRKRLATPTGGECLGLLRAPLTEAYDLYACNNQVGAFFSFASTFRTSD